MIRHGHVKVMTWFPRSRSFSYWRDTLESEFVLHGAHLRIDLVVPLVILAYSIGRFYLQDFHLNSYGSFKSHY